jgi:hypothetical protein
MSTTIPQADLDLLEAKREEVASRHRERARAAGVDGSANIPAGDPMEGLRRVAPGGLDGGPIGSTATWATAHTPAARETSRAAYERPQAAGMADAAPAATRPPAERREPEYGGLSREPYSPTPIRPEAEPEEKAEAAPQGLQEYYSFKFIGDTVAIDLDLPAYLGLGETLAITIPPITVEAQDQIEWFTARYGRLSTQYVNTEDAKQAERIKRRRQAVQEEMVAYVIPTFKEYPGLILRMGLDTFNAIWAIVGEMSKGATAQAAAQAQGYSPRTVPGN